MQLAAKCEQAPLQHLRRRPGQLSRLHALQVLKDPVLGELRLKVPVVADGEAEGLAALINDQKDMKVVGHAGTVAESVGLAAELKPDLVLIDFRLTDGTGADAATAIRQLRPETKLIFLTREDSDAARFAQLLNSRREIEAQLEKLTAREKEVLRLMAEGIASRDIASKLGISYTTVRTHIRSLGSKLGVHSKLEAIVKARELALVE